MVALGSRGEDPGGEGTKCGGAGVRELAASARDSGLLRRWGFLCGLEKDGVREDPQSKSLAPGEGPCLHEGGSWPSKGYPSRALGKRPSCPTSVGAPELFADGGVQTS